MREITLDASAWEGVDPGVEALLDRWLVSAGTGVAAGQVLAKVVLVKANLDITAPAAGRVEAILVPAGATFRRGAALATWRDES